MGNNQNLKCLLILLALVFMNACGPSFKSHSIDENAKVASTVTSENEGVLPPPPAPPTTLPTPAQQPAPQPGPQPNPLPLPQPTPNPTQNPMPTPQPLPPPPGMTQILVLGNPNLSVQAGQSVSLVAKFNAAPMTKDFAVFVHFIDANGIHQSSFNADFAPSTSTRVWSGAVSYTRTITIPRTAPLGKYTVKMGLFENVPPYNNRPLLAMGPGVSRDEQIRYIVGTLTVMAPPPPPPPQPQPQPQPLPTQGGIPTPGSLQNLTPSGPITLESNRTYSNLRISNPNGRCIYGYKVTNVRITNSEIGPCGNGSSEEHSGIVVHTSSNVRIDHNVIHDVSSGVVAVSSTGVVTSHNHISGLRGPFPAGQVVLYDKNYGAGNKILCNIGDNTTSNFTEDNISTYKSHGVPDNYIEIAYNRIRGGHSKTGTGINIGDDGSSYVDVHDNTIVNVNNAGLAISSGHNILLRNNRIYNNGPYSSVGLSIRNWYAGCRDIQVSNNRVWAFDHIWGMNSVWHYLNTGECTNVSTNGNTFGDTSLSAAIFDEPYPQCN